MFLVKKTNKTSFNVLKVEMFFYSMVNMMIIFNFVTMMLINHIFNMH
jgi:hypothetical protein